MKIIILMGFLLFLFGCANNPVINLFGDRYVLSLEYIDEKRYETQTEGLESTEHDWK